MDINSSNLISLLKVFSIYLVAIIVTSLLFKSLLLNLETRVYEEATQKVTL
jgi:hypothetical protein